MPASVGSWLTPMVPEPDLPPVLSPASPSKGEALCPMLPGVAPNPQVARTCAGPRENPAVHDL